MKISFLFGSSQLCNSLEILINWYFTPIIFRPEEDGGKKDEILSLMYCFANENENVVILLTLQVIPLRQTINCCATDF